MEQKSLKDSLVEILGEGDDYSFNSDDIAEFVLKITKLGSGIDTSYRLLPKVRPVEPAVKEAFDAVKDTAKLDLLLEGRHPLRQPRAEFSSLDSEF